ncbi:type II and III secretion system protein family protein [Sandarakinorhabdus sp.]|uniref:type II and III secretion system protein family protein n=1 Tax=Sandarakinorhabdus sp. TaxID=1916663 RepID=UPI00286DDE04|nr:type II and III secretion system protein family protein [Sandarakinorhabdus sp.]
MTHPKTSLRCLALALAFAAPIDAPSTAQAQSGVAEARSGAQMLLPVNKSQTLRVPRPYARVAVGNPKIADVVPVSSTSVYLLGKDMGSTNLTLYDRTGGVIAIIDVIVTPDALGLKQKLAEILPTEAIGVQVSNDNVVLSGTVSSAAAAGRAAIIAETYAPKRVINMMGIGTAQQILLEVRFAEMQRGTVKRLGINRFDFTSNRFDYSPDTPGNNGQVFAPGPGGTGNFTAGVTLPNFRVSFSALEQQGLIRTLAQPNIVALSGETATFLAGGEFPVPVGVALNGQVSIEFKQFGVGLAFTPTLLEDGLVNLVISPEVSSLDPAAGIDIAGLRVPGLKVRRARTTLELRDGETFALAGLIQSDFKDTVRAVPLLGKVPIIGALFRSTDFDRQETELVILVTPRIVRPVKAGTKLVLPTDRILEPGEGDLFLLGKAERKGGLPTAPTGPLPGPAGGINQPGGIAAEHGHIVR